MKTYPNYRTLERLSSVSWHDLIGMEPVLADLLWQARQACVRCRRMSDVDRVFAPIRNALADLVGVTGKHRAHPVLGGPGAYEVAYWRLYDAVAGLLPGRAGDTAEARPAESAVPVPTRV
jgi:hypothetical protein